MRRVSKWSLAFLLICILPAQVAFPQESAISQYVITLKTTAGDVLDAGNDLARLYGLEVEYQVNGRVFVTMSRAKAMTLSSDPCVESVEVKEAGEGEFIPQLDPATNEIPTTSKPSEGRVWPAAPEPSAQNPGDERQYILVLKAPEHGAPDLDLKNFGAKAESEWSNRKLIRIPEAAVKALSEHPRVKYLQRVVRPDESSARQETGTSTSGAPGSSKIGASAIRAMTTSSWTTGTYQYDGSGNIGSIGPNSDNRTAAYTYDPLSRLAGATSPTTSADNPETYKYDGFGNLLEKKRTESDLETNVVDTATNRLSPAMGASYDYVGNLTQHGAYTYTYDPLNMMTKLNHPTSGYRFYLYTADDERIGMKTGSSQWNFTIRDLNGKVLREYECGTCSINDWLWIEDYVYRGGQLLAAEQEAAEGGRRHLHLDHLGTPRMITNESHQLLSFHTYYPFGREVTSMQQETNRGYDREEPIKFTGHQRDFIGGTGDGTANYLDYMHARYFAPVTGRFLSVDPVLDMRRAMRSPALLNRYN